MSFDVRRCTDGRGIAEFLEIAGLVTARPFRAEIFEIKQGILTAELADVRDENQSSMFRQIRTGGRRFSKSMWYPFDSICVKNFGLFNRTSERFKFYLVAESQQTFSFS